MRFSFIGDVCGRCVVKPHESREHVRSVKIDRILTGRYTAIPAFLVIMGLVFWLTFGVIGAALQGLMEDGIAAIIASADAGLKAFGTNDVVRSLGCRRRAYGRGQCADLPADYRRALFVPLHSGRLRIHGARGLCHG